MVILILSSVCKSLKSASSFVNAPYKNVFIINNIIIIKPMYGQYPKRVNEKDVDHQMTNTNGLRQLGLSPKQKALSLLPKIRPSRPTTIVERP